MAKKKLQELNLLDNFLFEKMVTYPGLGEEFCKKLISIVLGINLNKLKIVPQKVYPGADTDLHGARLDVYIEEDGEDLSGTLFDFEPDQTDAAAKVKALPQRVRLYHAMIDQECLKSGQDYENLKRAVIIMMTPYDPFGQDYMMYTIQNRCLELPDMPYDDGARTLFLYTKGTKGIPSQSLKEFLHYMEHSTEENACNDTLKDIHRMVAKVKQDKEVSLEYMKVFEQQKLIYEQGIEQGIRQGVQQGGELNLIRLVCKKLEKNCSVPDIADMLETDEPTIQAICDTAKTFAPDYDAEKILVALHPESEISD